MVTGKLSKIFSHSQVPLYIQLASTLRRRIEKGFWKKGDKISTLDELVVEFDVGRVTVRQAIDLLQEEGLVKRQQGKGTFVVKQIKKEQWLKLEVSMSSMLETLSDNKPKFLSSKSPILPPQLNSEEGKLADEYVCMESVQFRDKKPYGIVKVHLDKYIFELAPESFHKNLTLAVLPQLESLKIKRAHQTLIIGTADTETAQLLDTGLNAPTAEVHCVVTDENDVAIYVADIIYRGDCIKFDIQLLQSSVGN
ncbi:MAG: GntR family transcriptional regulator [Rhodospirillales bacterium]|nr:GntR family transcriptional regulator [Rhodospirillales bacterium]|tara:strand:+ start:6040 stop:6795 length:756 start_codon:yes stop_codon:yes gene_type:complete